MNKWFDKLVEALRMSGADGGEWALMVTEAYGNVHLAKVVHFNDGPCITIYNVNAIGLFQTMLCRKLDVPCTTERLRSIDMFDEDVQEAAWEVLEENFKVVKFDDN